MAFLSEYVSALMLLVMLAGLLAADHVSVFSGLVQHLPDKDRKKAIGYGLTGALVLRIAFLAAFSFLLYAWQVQALGALYLLFTAFSRIAEKRKTNREKETRAGNQHPSGFWGTVLKIKLADSVFAVEAILAAAALTVSLPETNLPQVGNVDGGLVFVMCAGGVIGLLFFWFLGPFSINLLQKKPGLETAAFFIIGWLGVKLAVHTLSYEELSVVPYEFAESFEWKLLFYSVVVLIAMGGWFLSTKTQPSRFEADLTRRQGS